jgi:small-conductance mechanosensitive channel
MTFTEMLSSALATVIAFLPNLLAAAVILVVGLLIAMVLGRVTRRVLARIELHRRSSVRQAIDDEEMLTRLPGTLGRVVYWAVALLTIGLAVDALQLTWLSAGVASVVAYLPSVLAAAAILIGAYLLSNFLYQRTSRSGQEAGAEHPAPQLWPDLLRAAIWVVAGFMALQELGIATTIVTSAFIIGLAAIAIAGAVAFGLGNRELAGRIMNDWYERRRIEREEARTMRHEPHPPAAHH